MNEMYAIKNEEGVVVRKVSCPPGEIAQQVTGGETFEPLDPLVDGFGLTEPAE